jgi:hypothetical protein
MSLPAPTAGVELLGDEGEAVGRILTADALAFVAELQQADGRPDDGAATKVVRDDPTWLSRPRRALVEGLCSGAQMFVAGFDDADPVAGQANLLDAVEGTIALEDGSQRSSSGRANGGGRRSVCSSAASRSPQEYSISDSSPSTAAAGCWTWAPARTSTWAGSRRVTRRGAGTTSSCPDLVPTAMCLFDHVLGERPNQLDRTERS